MLEKILEEIEKNTYGTNTDYGHSVVVNMDDVARIIRSHMKECEEVNQLKAELAAERQKHRWIPVEEDTPEELCVDIEVITLEPDGDYRRDIAWFDGRIWRRTENDYEDLYCEQCGDSDWLIGFADTREEAWDLLKDDTNINGSGGWDYDYVRAFIDGNWDV